MQPRLAVTDLACRRGDRLLFAGLSFELEAGAALQVTGQNGTGKSSLLRIIAGLLRPFAGTVHASETPALLDGRLPLDEHLPLARALGFWELLDGVRGDLEGAGLAPIADVPVRFLSTGQRKRAAILQANARGAGIWLLDEPLNGLDAASAERLQGDVAAYCARGGIAVIASHQRFAVPALRAIALADYAA